MKEFMKCDYCGKIKTEVKFYIGASLGSPDLGYDWTMWEGTGRISCDSMQCFELGKIESKKTIHKATQPIGG